MKVIKSEDNLLVFDNGLSVIGVGNIDCCAINYLDFEQLPVGTEVPTQSIGPFSDNLYLEDDGFVIKDSTGLPKWVQARSEQNGYYSDMSTLELEMNGHTIRIGTLTGEQFDN